MIKKPRVATIILSYNVEKDLLGCLESLEKSATKGVTLTVIVVDNKSTDDSVVSVRNRFPQVLLIENEENLGYAGGNNVGIRYALEQDFDFVLVINPDTILMKNTLIELLKPFSTDKSIGMTSPKIYFAKGFEYHKEKYLKKDLGKVLWWAGGRIDWENVLTIHFGVDEVDRGRYDQALEIETMTGTAMCVRTEVFRQVGLFDERYFLYFEESDFCLRARKAGFKLFYVPTSRLWHKNARSSGVGSELHDYYTTRNRLLFGLSHAPLKSKIALYKEALILMIAGRQWQKRGILDFLLNNFGKGNYL